MFTAPLLALAGLLAAHPAKPAYVIEAPDVIRVEVTGLPKRISIPSGKFQVHADGTVYLGHFGSVPVAGLTTEHATAAVAKALSADLSKKARRKLKVTVTVTAFNSKRYYVITDFAGGEKVTCVPYIGNGTVLDEVGSLLGSRATATKVNIWVARDNSVLPIDWRGITQRSEMATNYELLPGDRLYIKAAK